MCNYAKMVYEIFLQSHDPVTNYSNCIDSLIIGIWNNVWKINLIFGWIANNVRTIENFCPFNGRFDPLSNTV